MLVVCLVSPAIGLLHERTRQGGKHGVVGGDDACKAMKTSLLEQLSNCKGSVPSVDCASVVSNLMAQVADLCQGNLDVSLDVAQEPAASGYSWAREPLHRRLALVVQEGARRLQGYMQTTPGMCSPGVAPCPRWRAHYGRNRWQADPRAFNGVNRRLTTDEGPPPVVLVGVGEASLLSVGASKVCGWTSRGTGRCWFDNGAWRDYQKEADIWGTEFPGLHPPATRTDFTVTGLTVLLFATFVLFSAAIFVAWRRRSSTSKM